MKDRSVQFPNRYRLTKVAGTDDIYDLDPAPGEISEEGTLINKGTLLSDETATKFFESLVGTETVDQVLGMLGIYNLHWWKRRQIIASVNRTSISGNVDTSTASQTFWYSDTVTPNLDGTISLGPSRTSVNVDYNTNWSTYKNFFSNKYWLSTIRGGTIVLDNVNSINYGGTISTASTSLLRFTGVSKATSVISYEDWEYVQSADRNAYPDSGESGGYEYHFLGKPLDNAVTAPEIEVFNYTGTGTYGSDNPTVITFPFVPQIIGIQRQTSALNINAAYIEPSTNGGISGFIVTYTVLVERKNRTTRVISFSGGSGSTNFSLSDDNLTLSLYGNSADVQMNNSNNQYTVFALG